MKLIKHLLLIILYILTPNTYTKNIIFDLGGVVFKTNKLSAFKQIGIHNFALYTIWHLKNPMNIKNIMYSTMNKVAPWPKNFTDQKPTDDKGNKIPYLMYCWLTGKMSTQKIKDTIIPAINLHLDWFANKTEQTLVKNTITMIFTPKIFIETQRVNPHAISLITACRKAGHQVYVLSNWDQESFPLLKNKHKKLFDLFDGIIISGSMGQAKPSNAIYTQLLKTYNLQARDCYFIDDQQVNITAAEQCGIHGILYTGTSLQNTTFA